MTDRIGFGRTVQFNRTAERVTEELRKQGSGVLTQNDVRLACLQRVYEAL